MYRFLFAALVFIMPILLVAQDQCWTASSQKHSQYHLTLYYKVDCPYCHKVNRYLNQMGIVIPMREVNQDQSYRPALVGMVGRSQVPCLVIDGEPLIESDAIIRWIEEHLVREIPS